MGQGVAILMEALGIAAVFAYIALIFVIRYLIGEKTFWGRDYLRQGYQMLLSRRIDGYLFDTLAICFLTLFILMLYFGGISNIHNMGTAGAILCGLSVLMFTGARLLVKSCVLYNEQGLLLSKPFRDRYVVTWDEIKSIQRKSSSAQIYHVLDQDGRRLTWFALTQKTQPFLKAAQRHGIDARIPKGTKMALETSSKRLNGTLGDWDVALARSAYSQNDAIAIAAFQDFVVALFMDQQLSENNVAAINQDGTTRWKISDIVKQPNSIFCTALSPKSADTIRIMAVTNRQYDCLIYEIDVYRQKIVRQYSGDDV